MNVLSLFDGLSGGQIALDRAGIKVDNYYASEVDKYAITVTQNNYPNTIQLGDIVKLSVDKLRELENIDLLIGGSSCQNFSMLGKRNGMSTSEGVEVTSLREYLELKALGFEFEGLSYLFWEYVRVLKTLRPKYFLLENVKMSNKWKAIITETLGVEPILIDSALVSAQHRERLYWTNIPGVSAPSDRGILLRDILEYDTDDIEITTPTVVANIKKAGNMLDYLHGNGFITIPCDYSYLANKFGYTKSPTLTTGCESGVVCPSGGVRRFTITELERLQTLTDGYTSGVSNTRRKHMIGNSWTVDIVADIFKNLKEEE